MKIKKLLLKFFCLVICLSIAFLADFKGIADIQNSYSNYVYRICDNNEVQITGFLASQSDIVNEISIPEKINEYLVTSIYEGAFHGCKYIKTITIPNTIVSIGESAFGGCSSVTTINFNAKFNDSSFEPYYDSFFAGCSSLKTVNFGSDAERISSYIFYGCDNIENIVISDGIRELGNYAFAGYKGSLDLNLPESLVNIGDYAFSNCKFSKNIKIPDNVKKIGNGAFFSCENLKEISIPNKVTEISDDTFSNCECLEEISIPKSIISIGNKAFYNCKNIKTINYGGSKSDWEKIKIYDGNSALNYAEINYLDGNSHKYTNDCDIDCNICNEIRVAKHNFEIVTTTKANEKIDGKSVVKCSVCKAVAITNKIDKIDSIKLSETAYTYNGKVKKPTVTVKDSSGKTISSKYYTVKYASGRKNVGEYKVVVTFKGNYSGTKTLYFKINPVNTSVSRVIAGKKSLKAYVNKKSTQVTGYQLYYSTSKNFKSYKSKYITNYKTTSATLKSLSAKKTYYVKVRTYKTVNGVKYYSGWSTVKYKKTK